MNTDQYFDKLTTEKQVAEPPKGPAPSQRHFRTHKPEKKAETGQKTE